MNYPFYLYSICVICDLLRKKVECCVNSRPKFIVGLLLKLYKLIN